jgi:hypothetical protein
LESANVGQLWTMWTTHTAAGQNVWSWVWVGAALAFWWNYYRVVTPQAVWARRSTEVGLVMNVAVIATVLWWG